MHVSNLAHYFWQAVQSTGSQLLILLGPGLALALVMHLLAGFVAARACRIIGRSAFLVFFGWLGTIVHEGGHALFCLLFGHRITAVKWFDLHGSGGSLGYVKHSYDRTSLYQRSGQFFIGIGPILLGTAVIYYASLYLLGPDIFAAIRHNTGPVPFNSIPPLASLAESIGHSCADISSAIFTGKNLSDLKFYLFLYLAFAIGSAITLSPQDVKGAGSGLCILAGLLLLFNIVTNWLGMVPESLFRELSRSCAVFYLAMVFVILMNALVAAVLLLLSAGAKS